MFKFKTQISRSLFLLVTISISIVQSNSSLAVVSESAYGICAHISRHSDHRLAKGELELMQEAGIGWVRTDFDWTTVQPSQNGDWDFSMIDETVEWAEDAGIAILPILCYDVSWASPSYKHLDEWLEYVRRTVTRYKDNLRYWEVWNEQDLEGFWKDEPNPSNYTILLKATYEEIKKIDPKLNVLVGGMSGIPFEYIEGIYKAGGKDYFDIMAVHPYRYPNSPEAGGLESDLEKLSVLMAKYGDGNKDVWITEIGWPTHLNENFMPDEIIKTGLKTVNSEREYWRMAVLDDIRYPVQFQFSDERIKGMFPKNGSVSRLNIEKIKKLSTEKYDALLWPLHEGFAVEIFDAIESFVKEGGVIIFTQGVPLYYAMEQKGNGEWQQYIASESYRERLHIGWEAWWTKKGVAREIKKLSIAKDLASEINIYEDHPYASRFLNDSKLKEGDRFIPLIQASESNYTGICAAVFDLNSELSGAVIVTSLMMDFKGISEEKQASILPRAYMISLQNGIDKMFWYNLRARENDAYYNEDNFGIVHKDLSAKPAYIAMKTLNRARPLGSKAIGKITHEGTICLAGWKRENDGNGWAIWNSGTPRMIKLKVKGKVTEAFDYLGNNVMFKENDGWGTIEILSSPIYIIGPEEISFK